MDVLICESLKHFLNLCVIKRSQFKIGTNLIDQYETLEFKKKSYHYNEEKAIEQLLTGLEGKKKRG